MMESASRLRVLFVRIGAADAVAVEILQRHRVAHTLEENRWPQEGPPRLSPDSRQNRRKPAAWTTMIHANTTENARNHYVMRNHAIEVRIRC